MDIDGRVTYSEIRNITLFATNQDKAYSFFPNPFSENLRFSNKSDETLRLEIYSGLGLKLLEFSVPGQHEENLNLLLPAGNYLLRVYGQQYLGQEVLIKR